VKSRSVMLLIPRGTSMKWLEISLSLSTTLTKAYNFGTFSGLAKLMMSIEMFALLKNLPKSSHWFSVSANGWPTKATILIFWSLFILVLRQSCAILTELKN
jgi:hypothetical protein